MKYNDPNPTSVFPATAAIVHCVLDEIDRGSLRLLSDSDRTIRSEEGCEVYLTHDDNTVAWLISQGYVKPRQSIDVYLALFNGDAVPITELDLTGEGDRLLKFCQGEGR